MIAKMMTSGIHYWPRGFMAKKLLKCSAAVSDGSSNSASDQARVSFERWAARKLKEDGPSSLSIIEEMRRSLPQGSLAVESRRATSMRDFQESRSEGADGISLESALKLQNIRAGVDERHSDHSTGLLSESSSTPFETMEFSSDSRLRTSKQSKLQMPLSTKSHEVSTNLISEEKIPHLIDKSKMTASDNVETHSFGDPSRPQPLIVKRKTKFPIEWKGTAGTVMLVDKPQGWTSFAVCAKLRYLLNIQKVGHAGTLDPMATGLLIVCLGKATKLAERYQAMTKVYSGTLRLGELTPSLDSDTQVSDVLPWEHITDDDLERARHSFIGDILQTPPIYSAIKIKGERLYKKARRGEGIEIPPRTVSVTDFNLWRDPADSSTFVKFSTRLLDFKSPPSAVVCATDIDGQEICFRVTCSKGTYVRSLGADLARSVGSYGHLTSLRREKIGMFSVKDAWPMLEFAEKHAEDMR